MGTLIHLAVSAVYGLLFGISNRWSSGAAGPAELGVF